MWKVNYILLQTMKTDNKTNANCEPGRNCLFFYRESFKMAERKGLIYQKRGN
jgi:hypothetical protein